MAKSTSYFPRFLHPGPFSYKEKTSRAPRGIPLATRRAVSGRSGSALPGDSQRVAHRAFEFGVVQLPTQREHRPSVIAYFHSKGRCRIFDRGRDRHRHDAGSERPPGLSGSRSPRPLLPQLLVGGVTQVVAGVVHPRCDVARLDDDDSDPEVGQLEVEGLTDRFEGVLGRRIGTFEGRRHLALHRAHVDQYPTAPSPPARERAAGRDPAGRSHSPR